MRLLVDFQHTLRDMFRGIRKSMPKENPLDSDTLKYFFRSPSFLILGVVIALYFFYKKEFSTGGLVILTVAVIYGGLVFIPQITGGWGGIMPLTIAVMSVGLVVAYFLFIRSD